MSSGPQGTTIEHWHLTAGSLVPEAIVFSIAVLPVLQPSRRDLCEQAPLLKVMLNSGAVAGKGVECTVADGNQSTSVRFGSLDYIQETLPSSQASRLKSMVSGLRDSSVVSVLVKSPADEQHSSSPDSSILLR